MTPSPFLQMLKTEVGKMQIMHPEREGELARASALIWHGMVLPSADDPATGKVLSSDMQRTYSVNGTCDCQAGEHGKSCKHVHAWRLYRYIEKKLDAQENCSTTGAPAAPLPEAPASVNVRLQIAGREVQWTLRDQDEAHLAARLEALLTRYPVQAPRSLQVPREGWCAVHNVAMQETTKNGRTWRSHRTADGWCKGK